MASLWQRARNRGPLEPKPHSDTTCNPRAQSPKTTRPRPVWRKQHLVLPLRRRQFAVPLAQPTTRRSSARLPGILMRTDAARTQSCAASQRRAKTTLPRCALHERPGPYACPPPFPNLAAKTFFPKRRPHSDCSRASMRGYGAAPQVASAPGCEAGRRRRRAVCAVALLAGLCAGVALAMSSGANAQTSLLALMTMVPVRVIRPGVRSRLNLPRSLRMKVDVFLSHSRFFFSFFSLSPSLSLSLFLSLSFSRSLPHSASSHDGVQIRICVCARACVYKYIPVHIYRRASTGRTPATPWNLISSLLASPRSQPRPGILATPWCVPQRAGLFVAMHACCTHLR